jgi:hypothetical protein
VKPFLTTEIAAVTIGISKISIVLNVNYLMRSNEGKFTWRSRLYRYPATVFLDIAIE